MLGDGGNFIQLGPRPAELVGAGALSAHHTCRWAPLFTLVCRVATQMTWKETLMGSLIKCADDVRLREEANGGCQSRDPKETHESGVSRGRSSTGIQDKH